MKLESDLIPLSQCGNGKKFIKFSNKVVFANKGGKNNNGASDTF